MSQQRQVDAPQSSSSSPDRQAAPSSGKRPRMSSSSGEESKPRTRPRNEASASPARWRSPRHSTSKTVKQENRGAVSGEGSEPATESDGEPFEPVAGPSDSSSRMPREGVFGMTMPGENLEGTDGEEDEPKTESSDGEPLVAYSELRGGQANGGLSPGGRAPTQTLDLTDDGDEALPATYPPGAHPSSTIHLTGSTDSTASSSDDDVEILPTAVPRVSSSSRDKGKGRAIPSASPSTAADAPTEALPSLATLSCPICLGPPTPLALTSCGHAFCAPCLHAALVAGPALTPPPPGSAAARAAPTTFQGRPLAGGGWRGGGLVPGGASRGARGAGGRGGSGRGGSGRGGARGSNGAGGGPTNDDEGDPELDKHCPVCRTPLYGGWGRSLRGLVVRMAPVPRGQRPSVAT